MSTFNDPAAVANYAQGPIRMVPGFLDLQKMSALLLGERVASSGKVLVHGAGGGLELRVFAGMQPDWTFVGVDPSAEMLKLARQTIGTYAARVDLHEGYIETAPRGPFDGATSLLTLHFIPRDDRLRTLIALRERLKPGAPLIVAHHSYPQTEPAKSQWLGRFAAFATASGIDADKAQTGARGISERLPALSPEDDEALLWEAGFKEVSLFYAAFSFRGWVAYNG